MLLARAGSQQNGGRVDSLAVDAECELLLGNIDETSAYSSFFPNKFQEVVDLGDRDEEEIPGRGFVMMAGEGVSK
jgi:hypothetical protein